jgi:alpha-tubulin suppressor-like RCC1 family protein
MLTLGHLLSTCKPKVIQDLDEQEVVMVACGSEHTVLITIVNEVYGFGNGVFDQLGLGTLGTLTKPLCYYTN